MAYPRIRIEDAGKHAGEAVEIAGWLYNLRKSGKIVFPLLRDGSGTMQCVAVKANDEALFDKLKDLTQESSVILRGKIRAEQRASLEAIAVLNPVELSYSSLEDALQRLESLLT